MALITIGTNLLDTSDIALVAPRGSLSTVYLADSLQLESALSAADQAAAVNAAAAATLTTAVVSSNFGSCYINGLNVQRVLGDGGAGTTWYLRGGPGAVVCPATDLTAAGVLIAAASGSPGNTVFFGAFSPVVTTNPEVNYIDPIGLGFDVGFYTRAGGPVAAVGDVVTLYFPLGAENPDVAPQTAQLMAALPATMTFNGAGAPAFNTSIDASGSDPWDGAPWAITAVQPGGVTAVFDLDPGEIQVRWISATYRIS